MIFLMLAGLRFGSRYFEVNIILESFCSLTTWPKPFYFVAEYLSDK